MTQTYQSWFKTTLTRKLSSTGTTAYVQTAPTVTKWRMYVKSGTREEWFSFSWVSWSTLTGLTRWLSQTADPATSGTGQDWLAWTTIYLVAMHDQIPDKQENTSFTWTLTVSWAISATDISFTGTTTGWLKVKSLTTVQRDALTPANGMIIYNTTDWEFQIYQTSAWSTMASGSTQPNASTTVAGKVEIATDAEITSWTSIWWTWAILVGEPSQLKKSISLKNSDTATAETDYFVFSDTSASNEDKKILKSDLRNDLASTDTLKGTVEKATSAELQAWTADKFPDSAVIAWVYGAYQRVYITSNFTTSSTSLVDVTNLSLSLESGKKYNIRYHMMYSLDSWTSSYSVTASIKYNGTSNYITWFGTNIPSISANAFDTSWALNANDDLLPIPVVATANLKYHATFEWFIDTTSASTIIARIKTNWANLTVHAGSYIEYYKIN